MRIDILTLFPEMFTGPFDTSIIKRAQNNGLLHINLHNIRDFSQNKHNTTDDTPYGGGAGMVMQAEPIFEAMEFITADKPAERVVMLCPQGRPFDQAMAKDLASQGRLVLICGHYEGIDERVKANLVTDEISIGDYVLTGGELPAMVVVDAVARMIPGVLGEMASAEADSFYDGLLEHPHYTRPRLYQDMDVPEVLLSGHHGKIAAWRRRQSLVRTLERRPDLLKTAPLSKEDLKVLQEIHQDLKEILPQPKS